MGNSRFGKYGDTKRKALIRKNRLRPTLPQYSKKETFSKRNRKNSRITEIRKG